VKLIYNFMLIAVLVLCPVSLRAATSSTALDTEHSDKPVHIAPKALVDKYNKVEKELGKSPFSIPFFIESAVSKNASRVDIYGTVNYPFDPIKKEFLVPANWCDVVLPHVKVGACTYRKVNDTWLLNIYNVDKFSAPLEDAYQMKFEYRVSALQAGYFDILLTAQKGPFHTKDHQFRLEAIPLRKDTTFIHLRYSYRYGSLAYLFMKLFGGSKVGFSVTGTDSNGNPVYVEGLRGSVERDVVCYYLAILAYLDTREIPAGQRFEKQIGRWYDLAALYKKQLLDMGKEEYLTRKRKDRESQQKLQETLGE
jgi:hypothetical protein